MVSVLVVYQMFILHMRFLMTYSIPLDQILMKKFQVKFYLLRAYMIGKLLQEKKFFLMLSFIHPVMDLVIKVTFTMISQVTVLGPER